jgi:hypothetical protein
VVTGANSLNEPRMGEQVVVQGLASAVGGGISMLIVGFVKHSIDQNKSMKR